jgi:amino acid adenylation domain-containing protein
LYNVAAALRLDGPVDPARLAAALAAAVEREAILRMTLVHDELGLRQKVAPHADPAAVTLCERPAPPEAIEAAQARLAFAPFDLERGPLFRCAVHTHAGGGAGLLVSAHHSCFDGYSLRILLARAAELYRGSQPADIAPSFLDLGLSPEFQLRRAESLAFWRERFSTAPPQPDDCGPGRHDTAGAERIELALSPTERALLARWCRKRAFSLPALLFAIYALTIARTTGRRDPLVGLTASGRSDAQSRAAIGPLSTVLPIRSEIDWSRPLDDWLREARLAIKRAQAHQSVSLPEILEAAGAPRPTLAFAFNFFAPDAAVLALPDVECRGTELSQPLTAFGLLLRAVEREHSLALQFDHRLDFLEPGDARRFAARYRRALLSVLDEERVLTRDLAFLSDSERQRHAAPADAAVATPPLLESVARHAAEAPDGIALEGGGERVTRLELEARADSLAAELRRAGVARGEAVAVVAPRGLDAVIGQYAALKAGAAFVPIDAAQPPQRLAAMLGQAGSRFVLGDGVSATAVGGRALLPIRGASRGRSESFEASARDKSECAYVIFTSGSTGAPKGVAIEFRSLENLIGTCVRRFGIDRHTRCSAVASPSFDASIAEIWPALCGGATLVFAPDHLVADVGAFSRWLVAERIDVAFSPTAVGELLITARWPAETCLRTFFLGGERLQKRPRPGQPFAVWNAYGPAEACVISSLALVEPGPAGIAPDIGRPIEGMKMAVTDGDGFPLPDGALGEIRIGGIGLARCYVGEPELTAARFVRDPVTSTRFYATGDSGLRRPDGSFDCVGRLDRQVKVRGQRVELGEIEAALSKIDSIETAAAVAVEDPPRSIRIVAFYTSRELLDTRALRRALLSALPPAMVPTAFIRTEALPVTISGKIDRAKLERTASAPPMQPPGEARTRLDVGLLKQRLADRSAAEAPAALSRDALVRSLQRLWAERLQIPDLLPDDDLFDLGAHSILAVEVAVELSSAHGLTVSVNELFEHPTISAFADHFVERMSARTGDRP